MEIKIRTYEEFRADRVTIEITGTGAEVRDLVDSESSTKLPSRNLYTDEEVAALQASEAELVAGPLRARINDLETSLNATRNRVETVTAHRVVAENKVRELEEELTRRAGIVKRLENKVEAYDTDRHTERDRADRAVRMAREQEGRAEELDRRLSTSLARVGELERFLAREVKRAEELETKLMEGHVCTGGCSENQHVAFVGRKALTELENQVAALTRRIDNTRVILSDPQVTGALNRAVRDQHESGLMAQAIEKALDTLA